MGVANKNLMNELESLAAQLEKSKVEDAKKDYILKVDQQQDGSMNFSVYAGDNLLYESLEHYEMDFSDFRHETSCINDHCKRTMEYGLIEDTALSNKIRVEEKYYDNSDHFNMNLAFYDESGNVVGKYGAELSFQYNQDVESKGHLIIHDLFVI